MEMDGTGLGGAILLIVRCEGCGATIIFLSLNGTDVKTKVVASFDVAGIPFAKYHRWGTCIGK